MIYVSLPVHEKFDVIANQLQNFKKYLPEAMIVLHLSAGAHFSTKELDGFLKLNRVDNYIINPVQLNAAWGSIIEAHLSNVEFVLQQGDAQKVIFHSSNDMLIREGLSSYLKDKTFLFHHREVFPKSHWWPANVAIDDIAFTDWLSVYGGAIVASQIEGSMYGVDFLREFNDQYQWRYKKSFSSLSYPREEFFFSSLARAFGIVADGLPYVFSEVHRFDKKLWAYYENMPLLLNNNPLSKKIKKQLIDKLFDYGDYKISIKDIEAIRNQDDRHFASIEYLSDGNNRWRIHTIDNLFAVKRVPRMMTDKIRQYISSE
ncbi:hypothetical protein LU290_00350 [Moraxella nasibovis]|uniref:hypothetical protein n=1 Tax=Moraxella nasibovis TaxID=2904120 RepID=UPI00240F1DE2|nr:hypothetical protein [Moraxella nasibovis]WFF38735.1 hypothetical protein LU290_00350 [Moraxella nasibovis]